MLPGLEAVDRVPGASLLGPALITDCGICVSPAVSGVLPVQWEGDIEGVHEVKITHTPNPCCTVGHTPTASRTPDVDLRTCAQACVCSRSVSASVPPYLLLLVLG